MGGGVALMGEGQLFAELLHYPVAIAANCNFPSVLGEITTQRHTPQVTILSPSSFTIGL